MAEHENCNYCNYCNCCRCRCDPMVLVIVGLGVVASKLVVEPLVDRLLGAPKRSRKRKGRRAKRGHK